MMGWLFMRTCRASVCLGWIAVLLAGEPLPPSLSIGADWDADQVVPWQQGVSEATLVIEGLEDGSRVGARHLLLGDFDAGAWTARIIRQLIHDQIKPGVDRYRFEFDPVVGRTVMLVVVAGSTTGFHEPVSLVFGQLTGDVSGDRKVTAIDALMVLNHVDDPSPDDPHPYDPRLDVDANGEVTPGDAQIILNLINNHPGGVPFAETGPMRPPPKFPARLSLALDRPRHGVVLTLSHPAFGHRALRPLGQALPRDPRRRLRRADRQPVWWSAAAGAAGGKLLVRPEQAG